LVRVSFSCLRKAIPPLHIHMSSKALTGVSRPVQPLTTSSPPGARLPRPNGFGMDALFQQTYSVHEVPRFYSISESADFLSSAVASLSSLSVPLCSFGPLSRMAGPLLSCPLSLDAFVFFSSCQFFLNFPSPVAKGLFAFEGFIEFLHAFKEQIHTPLAAPRGPLRCSLLRPCLLPAFLFIENPLIYKRPSRHNKRPTPFSSPRASSLRKERTACVPQRTLVPDLQ